MVISSAISKVAGELRSGVTDLKPGWFLLTISPAHLSALLKPSMEVEKATC